MRRCGDGAASAPLVELLERREVQCVHVEERCHRCTVVEGVGMVSEGALEALGKGHVLHVSLATQAPDGATLCLVLADD